MIKFIYEYPPNDRQRGFKVEMEISEDSTLLEAVETFEQFLRGCGYSFDGQLGFVDADWTVPKESTDEVEEAVE